MLSAMAKITIKKPDKPDKPAGIFFRPDPDTEAALQAFVEAQPVEPTSPAVALTALRYFLKAQGFYPPPPKPPAK